MNIFYFNNCWMLQASITMRLSSSVWPFHFQISFHFKLTKYSTNPCERSCLQYFIDRVRVTVNLSRVFGGSKVVIGDSSSSKAPSSGVATRGLRGQLPPSKMSLVACHFSPLKFSRGQPFWKICKEKNEKKNEGRTLAASIFYTLPPLKKCLAPVLPPWWEKAGYAPGSIRVKLIRQRIQNLYFLNRLT